MQMKSLFVLLASGMLAACGASGDKRPKIDDVVPVNGAYLADGSGNAVISGDKNCYRSGSWTKGDKVDGCEFVAEAPAEEVAEVAPPPEPEPAPTPEPPRFRLVDTGDGALFEFDSADLTQAGSDSITQLIARLSSFSEIESIRVEGHTDTSGPSSYNFALSERRAETVKARLVEEFPGVDITTAGRGESSPAATNETPEGRRANRRVELIVRAKE